MLCAPADLVRKSQALINGWERYQSTPSFESFVELAVSINSFTEFLIDKGASALHYSSHQLEQVALALFNEEVNHPLSHGAWTDLNDRIVALTRIINEHVAVIESLAERRQDAQPAGHSRRASGIWLIGHNREIWQGAAQVRQHFPEAVSIYILPPSFNALRTRLTSRGQDSVEVIERRLAAAAEDVSHAAGFDYIIVNDDFDEALLDLTAIARSVRLTGDRQTRRHQSLFDEFRRLS